VRCVARAQEGIWLVVAQPAGAVRIAGADRRVAVVAQDAVEVEPRIDAARGVIPAVLARPPGERLNPDLLTCTA
jgi:hypothetical protein